MKLPTVILLSLATLALAAPLATRDDHSLDVLVPAGAARPISPAPIGHVHDKAKADKRRSAVFVAPVAAREEMAAAFQHVGRLLAAMPAGVVPKHHTIVRLVTGFRSADSSFALALRNPHRSAHAETHLARLLAKTNMALLMLPPRLLSTHTELMAGASAIDDHLVSMVRAFHRIPNGEHQLASALKEANYPRKANQSKLLSKTNHILRGGSRPFL